LFAPEPARIIRLIGGQVGQNYLRKILTSFKFELNMFVAALVALSTVSMLLYYGLLGRGRGGLVAPCLAAAAGTFFYFARCSSEVLDEIHRHLVDEMPEATKAAESSAPPQSTSAPVAANQGGGTHADARD
jgi:hypothetical protein